MHERHRQTDRTDNGRTVYVGCGHRGDCLRSQCRYDTIRFYVSFSSKIFCLASGSEKALTSGSVYVYIGVRAIKCNNVKMAGVVLETLSNRKLIAFGAVLLLVQIGFFLIGGLVGELSVQYHNRYQSTRHTRVSSHSQLVSLSLSLSLFR